MRRCFLLLIDGLRPDVAEAELAAGRLPHLARLVASGGVGRAITAFPSTTSVSYLPFLTGCTPGRCNIPSIRWLDRARYARRWWRGRNAVRSYCGYQAGMLDGDIEPDVGTMFELVPESVGIFTMIARGLGPGKNPARVARQFWGFLAHYAEWHQPSDESVAGHLLAAAARPERFVFAQFPAVDGYTHQSDPRSPRVLRSLARVDQIIGKLVERLAARGDLEETLILVVSDHGASVVKEHLDLPEWFRAQGVRTLAHPIVWERDPSAAVMVAGNASAMVYARPGVPRAERWPLERLRCPETFGTGGDLISRLLAEPAVAIVAAERGDGSVAGGGARGGGDPGPHRRHHPLHPQLRRSPRRGRRAQRNAPRVAGAFLERGSPGRRVPAPRPVPRPPHRRPGRRGQRGLRLPPPLRNPRAPLGPRQPDQGAHAHAALVQSAAGERAAPDHRSLSDDARLAGGHAARWDRWRAGVESVKDGKTEGRKVDGPRHPTVNFPSFRPQTVPEGRSEEHTSELQ